MVQRYEVQPGNMVNKGEIKYLNFTCFAYNVIIIEAKIFMATFLIVASFPKYDIT